MATTPEAKHAPERREPSRADEVFLAFALIAAVFLPTEHRAHVFGGFLQQWPTLVMFPILIFMYLRLARREEREVAAEFGDDYAQYRARTPPFLPKIG